VSSTIVRAVTSVADVDAKAWDALDHGPSPFLRHGFLEALEVTGSIAKKSGWSPVYLLVEQGGALAGAVAAFVKTHSYGEYIFDWGWASAAQRAGLRYYPKLVVAAPHTPATGPRMLIAPNADAAVVRGLLIDAVRALADETDCSSIHWLFCTAEEQALLAERGYLARASLQFHWHNRGYAKFEDFLGALKSRKRKQLRKERERARAAVERITWVTGKELDDARLDDLDRFYRNTTDAHGGRDYLRPRFFHELARRMPDELAMVEVVGKTGQRIAGAVFFETPRALYGRYWGCDQNIELLHFETAYYAGIERAIARGLPLFEAGAQGEHKLLRGFEPSRTYSAHWIRHAGLASAIADFTSREEQAMDAELAELAKYGPYRAEGED
jgi:predicted N-acyltransferase